MSYLVTEKAMRPASDKERCFYCREAVGGAHGSSCVLVKRKARVRMTVEYEIDIPAHWKASDVEFQRNEGSWCANNAIEELDEYDCLCPLTTFEFVDSDAEEFLDEE